MRLFARYLLVNVLRAPDDGAGAAAADTGAAPPAATVQVTLAGDKPLTAREAARSLSSLREKRDDPSNQSTQDPPPARREQAAPADPALPSGDEPDAAAAPPQPPGETEGAEPAEEPPIEPPRSWTKEARERFASLPRETQEYLASREQERDVATRRSQNEAAEQRKALEAERTKVEQARVQYEAALPEAMAALNAQHAEQFPDVKTYADVEKLAREDWPRYVLWDAQQKRIAGTRAQLAAASERQALDKQTKFADFAKRESELFAEKVPEAADPEKFGKLKDAALTTLRDLGFTDDELGKMWRGDMELSLHDHRLQLLLRDGVQFRAARAAAKNPTKQPVPPVVRPGTSQPRGAAAAQLVANLTQRLDKTGSLKDAARLLSERRKASR
jgi:hypothetical protein